MKSLSDKPYYYEDSGVKLEVKFNNGAGTSIRHQSIQREDMIEKAVTSICNSYMKSCFNPDISSHNCSWEFEWKRDLSNIPQQNSSISLILINEIDMLKFNLVPQ